MHKCMPLIFFFSEQCLTLTAETVQITKLGNPISNCSPLVKSNLQKRNEWYFQFFGWERLLQDSCLSSRERFFKMILFFSLLTGK